MSLIIKLPLNQTSQPWVKVSASGVITSRRVSNYGSIFYPTSSIAQLSSRRKYPVKNPAAWVSVTVNTSSPFQIHVTINVPSTETKDQTLAEWAPTRTQQIIFHS